MSSPRNKNGKTIATLQGQLTNAREALATVTRERDDAEALVERYEREAVPTHTDANGRMKAALGSNYSRLWGPTLEALGRQMDRVLHERDEAQRALADERERRERVEAAVRDFFDKPIRHVYPNGNRTGTTDHGPVEYENPVEPNERAWNERLAILRAALSATAADGGDRE